MQFSKIKQHLNNATIHVLVLHWVGLKARCKWTAQILEVVWLIFTFPFLKLNQYLMHGLAVPIFDFKISEASWLRDLLLIFAFIMSR